MTPPPFFSSDFFVSDDRILCLCFTHRITTRRAGAFVTGYDTPKSRFPRSGTSSLLLRSVHMLVAFSISDLFSILLIWNFRNLLWFFSQMINLYRPRSLLYRRQILQEIFVGKLLTRSTRFTCFCTAQTSIFQQNWVKLFRIFRQILQTLAIFEFFPLIFALILMKFCRNFADILEKNIIEFCSELNEILSEFRKYFQKC